MEQNVEYRQQLVREYKEAVVPLLRYLPWLRENAGRLGSTDYRGSGLSEHSIHFPVYDPTLMNFVKEASKSTLMDRNYSYVYTRNRIQNHDDERRMIASADIKDWNILRGILSKYVLGGRTKAVLWSQAVQERVFLLVLDQMRKIIEFWDMPLDGRAQP